MMEELLKDARLILPSGEFVDSALVLVDSAFIERARAVFKKWDLNEVLKERERFRFLLSHFSRKHNGFESFEKTWVVLRIDIDQKLSEEELEEFLRQIVPATYLVETVKGYHVLYFVKEPVLKDDVQYWGEVARFYSKVLKEKFSFVDKVDDTYKIATRASENVRKIGEAWDAKELVSAIEEYAGVEVEDRIKLKRSDYKGFDPLLFKNPEEVEQALDKCLILKELEKCWEDHSYHEWFIKSWEHALKDLAYGVEFFKEEFIRKSLVWKGKTDERTAEKQYEYTKRWIVKDSQFRVLGCRFISQNTRFPDLCAGCEIKSAQQSNFILSPLSGNYVLSVGPFRIKKIGKELYWVLEEGQEKEKPIAEAFKVERLYEIWSGSKVEWVAKLKFLNGRVRYEKVDYTSNANVNYANIKVWAIGEPKRYRELMKNLLDQAVLQNKKVEIRQVGYRFVPGRDWWVGDGKWSMVVAGLGEYDLNDVYYLVYNSVMDPITRPYLPSVSGEKSEWLRAYRELLKVEDPAVFLIFGYALSYITKHYLYYDRRYRIEFNPLLFIRGVAAIGKTLRTKFALALYGNPRAHIYSATTIAAIRNVYSFIKTPIVFDEVRITKKEDVDNLAKLIDYTANAGKVRDAVKSTEALDIPLILVGEEGGFNFEKVFDTPGIYRRTLVLLIGKRDEEVLSRLKELSLILETNYGFVYEFIKYLELKKRKGRIEVGELYNGVLFEEPGLESLNNLTNLILASLKLFYEFVGKELNEDLSGEVFKVIKDLVLYIRTDVKNFYRSYTELTLSPLSYRVINYLVLLSNFMREAQKKGASFSGMSFEQILSYLTREGFYVNRPNADAEDVIKKIFLKEYKVGNRHTYRYTKTTLVERDLGDLRVVDSDVERFSRLPQEYVDLYMATLYLIDVELCKAFAQKIKSKYSFVDPTGERYEQLLRELGFTIEERRKEEAGEAEEKAEQEEAQVEQKKVSETVLGYLNRIRQAEEEEKGKGEPIFKEALKSLSEVDFKELVKRLIDEGLTDYGYGVKILSEHPKEPWEYRRAILVLKKYEDYLKRVKEWEKLEWILQKEEEVNKALESRANRELNEFRKTINNLYGEIYKYMDEAQSVDVDEDTLIAQLKYAARKGVIDVDIRSLCRERNMEIKGPYAGPDLDFSWLVDYLVFMRPSKHYDFDSLLELAAQDGVYSFGAVLISLFVRGRNILGKMDLSLFTDSPSSVYFLLISESSFNEKAQELILYRYKKHIGVIKASLEELINDEAFDKLMKETYALPNWKDACQTLIEKCKVLMEKEVKDTYDWSSTTNSTTYIESKKDDNDDELDWLLEKF